MNQGQYIINMQQLIMKLQKATQSGNKVDYKAIRKMSLQIQNDALNVWDWAMKAEDQGETK